MPIRILLADDHALFRSGLAALLSAHADFAVVGEAADGFEAVRQAVSLRPDVVLMDIGMPGIGGVEATREIRRQAPSTRILALTQHDDEGYLRQMLKAGAGGYLVKKAADMELYGAVRAVARGELYLHPSMTRLLVEEVVFRPAAADSAKAEQLSERERETLRLLALGHTNREVAERLFVSVKTAETYKARIAEKLGLQRRSDLVRYARSLGLLSEEPG
ncbi:MAG TPA: response regulator transcription factor [Symbiobacteriaceae bacterium]|jgi:DNA-binding NarL/FixJ family response regulator